MRVRHGGLVHGIHALVRLTLPIFVTKKLHCTLQREGPPCDITTMPRFSAHVGCMLAMLIPLSTWDNVTRRASSETTQKIVP